MSKERGPDDCALPKKKVAQRYGVSTRSIDRWERDEQLNFPKSFERRKRRYWWLSDLTSYELARASAA